MCPHLLVLVAQLTHLTCVFDKEWETEWDIVVLDVHGQCHGRDIIIIFPFLFYTKLMNYTLAHKRHINKKAEI